MRLLTTPFNIDQIEKLIQFGKANPWNPNWPEDLMRRFLTEFISSGDLVFDLRSGDLQIAVAVLLDKVQNPGNFANLEILGVRSEQNPVAVTDEIFRLAKTKLPHSQSGFQFGFHESMSWSSDLISKHSLEPYYETYEMLNDDVQMYAKEDKSLRLAKPDDDSKLYQALVESFSKNVDTSIPEFSSWKASKNRSDNSRTWLAIEQNQIVGFLTLIITPQEKKAEIRTVGVMENSRGKGIGRRLIQNALKYLCTISIPACELTVAVKNERALLLYQNLGFKKTDHSRVYCWRRGLRNLK